MQYVSDIQIEANSPTAAVFEALLLQFKDVDFVQTEPNIKPACSGTAGRQAVTLPTFTQVTSEFSWRYNSTPGVAVLSPWGVPGYLLTSLICKEQLSAPEEGQEHLPFLVSRRLACLNVLAGSTERSPVLGFLEWSKWSFLLLTYLFLKEVSQHEERLSTSIHIKVNRGAFMFALNKSCAPLKNPQQGQLEELPVTPQSCGMNHCSPFLAERCLSASPGGIPSLKPLLAPAIPPWPAAAWQMHLTGC